MSRIASCSILIRPGLVKRFISLPENLQDQQMEAELSLNLPLIRCHHSPRCYEVQSFNLVSMHQAMSAIHAATQGRTRRNRESHGPVIGLLCPREITLEDCLWAKGNAYLYQNSVDVVSIL